MNKEEQFIFLNLVNEYEETKERLSELSEELKLTLAKYALGTYVQDPDSGVVYKIVKPNGTFVYYKEIDYVRTVKEGEERGTLSKKEAEGAGFVLLKK